MSRRARKLTATQDGSTHRITVEGVSYPMLKDRSGNWRVRKRSKHNSLDVGLGVAVLTIAKEKAKRIILTKTEKAHRIRSGGATLRELCNDYLAMPRDCRDYVAKQNITYLAAIVREALGKTLDQAHATDLTSALWSEYQRVSHGGKIDYALPRKGNAGINSAIRAARSIFAKSLEREYEQRGHRLDWTDLRRVKWLKELKTIKMGEPKRLLKNIYRLRKWLPLAWRAIGLARFAGLRQHEIQHAQRHWLERDAKGNTYVIVMHRPEEGFYAKGDDPRRSIILDATLADDLWQSKGLLAPHPPHRPRKKWFERDLNGWVRILIPDGKNAMHRLRGFYADDVAKLTEDAFAARLAGIRAAQAHLGHQDESTTVTSYLAKRD